MADYKLTATGHIIRRADRATIPPAPGNRDWDEYQEWLAAGNTPEPFVIIAPSLDSVDNGKTTLEYLGVS